MDGANDGDDLVGAGTPNDDEADGAAAEACMDV